MQKPLHIAWNRRARTSSKPKALEYRLRLAEKTLVELLTMPEPEDELDREHHFGSIDHQRDRIKHLIALLNPPDESTAQ